MSFGGISNDGIRGLTVRESPILTSLREGYEYHPRGVNYHDQYPCVKPLMLFFHENAADVSRRFSGRCPPKAIYAAPSYVGLLDVVRIVEPQNATIGQQFP